MGNTHDNTRLPYIAEKEGKVIEVNDELTILTGFNSDDLLGKPFFIVWKELLHINADPYSDVTINETFLFAKSLEARHVNIHVIKNNDTDGTKYIITEIPYSRLEDRFSYVTKLISDNLTGVSIYSVPELILLKANQMYFDLCGAPNNTPENTFGKQIHDIIPGYICSPVEDMLNTAITTGNSQCLKEFKYDKCARDMTYCDEIVTPIAANGRIRYIITNIQNVTERVLVKKDVAEKNKTIELRQQDQPATILKYASNAVAILDKEGYYLTFSKQVHDNYQLIRSTKKFGDSYKPGLYFDGSGVEIAKENMPASRVLRGENVQNERIVKKEHNKETHLQYSGSPIFDKKGEFEFIVVTCHDITEQKKIEEELIEVNNRLSVALESVGAGILELDVKSGNQIWSPRLYEIYGIDPSEPMPLYKGLAALYPDDREVAKRSLEEAYKHQREFWHHEFRIINPKRGIVWVDGTAKIIYDKLGNPVKHIGINIDISEQKKAEDALHISELRLSTALKGSPIVVFSQDCELRYTWVYNTSPGFKVEDVLGKRDDEIYSPEDACIFEVIKRDVISSGLSRRDEVVTHRPVSAGGDVIHDMTTEPLHDANGAIVGVICAAIEITERKRAEAYRVQLQQEKNEALEASIKMKDEFLYLITHEFKTPMAVVNSALQAIDLIHKKDVTENIGKYLKTIKQNTNRQLRLVNNLLDITRINSGHIKLNKGNFDIVYVTKAIINSVEAYASQKKVNLNFTSNITKKIVSLDEEKFERITLNLLANALKFTPRGKSINVSLFIKKKRNRNMICISVSDEGIGIPKERQQIIFERFGQVDSSLSRQAEGTGLGLHLVKLLVNAFEGEITLESREGEGSIFTVLLPSYKAPELDDTAACININGLFSTNDSRIIQAAAIEFSDIYFD